MNKELGEKDKIIIELESRINAILNSTSWRITYPLRLFKDKIIRFKELLRFSYFVFKKDGFLILFRRTLKFMLKKLKFYFNKYFNLTKSLFIKIYKLFTKALFLIKRDGLILFTKKVIKKIKNKIISDSHKIKNLEINLFNKQQSEFSEEDIISKIESFSKKPLISIIMPVYNTPPKWLKMAIDSLVKQLYENWELCAVDDCSTNQATKDVLKEYASLDKRIKIHFSSVNKGISYTSNTALNMSEGEYVGLLDHDDELTKDALFWCIKTINEDSEVDFMYSDECKIDDTNKRKLFHFYFKPDWSPEMLLNCMYTGHFTVYNKKLVNKAGNFRSEYDFSQDYDLALRVSEKAKKIIHIERVLYLWRAIEGSSANGEKDFARKSNLNALESASIRRGIPAKITKKPSANYLNILFDKNTKITIIIPTDSFDNLKRSLSHIISTTSYPNYEVIVVCNSKLIDNIKNNFSNNKNIIFLPYDKKFNFSDKCNFGAENSNGDILVFLNDDVYPKKDDWLEKLVEYLFLDDKVGGVSPKLLWKNNTIQYAGMTSNAIPFCSTFLNGRDSNEYWANVVRNTSILNGACLAIKKETFLSIGGFDAINTPAGHSDLDLSFKLRDNGYRCIFTPYSVLTHVGNHSWHIEKDKSDIYVLSRWGKYISNDPFYTKSMRTIMEGYYPEQFGIFSNQKEFKAYSFDALILIQELSITGAPIVALNLAKAIINSGGYPVIYSYMDGPLRFELEKLDIPVIVNNFASINNDFSFKYFAKNFDIVIANTVVVYPSVYSIQDIVPTIWYIHEAKNIESFFIPHFEKMDLSLLKVLKNTKATICVPSEYSFNILKKYNGNTKLLGYGFDDLYNEKDKNDIKNIQFSIIGTVEERKSQDIFVQAIIDMPENYRNKAIFNIIGNDKSSEIFASQLKNKIKNIPEIIWHGLVVDQKKKLDLFKNTSVIVTISRDDCSPLVVTEGAIFKKPSIISKNVGTGFLFENGITGFVVETEDVQELKKAMMNIIDNPKILIPMGEEIRKRYLATSTFSIFQNKLIKLIKEKIKNEY